MYLSISGNEYIYPKSTNETERVHLRMSGIWDNKWFAQGSHERVVVEYKILRPSISQGHILIVASFIIHILTSKCIVFRRLSILPLKMSFWLIPSRSSETSAISRTRCLFACCLSEVSDHPIAQGYTFPTTSVTRCGAQSGLGVCCWRRRWTKLEELFFQPSAFHSKPIRVPTCLNFSLSCSPGIGCFPLHYPVTLELKVQDGFGVALKLKRQEGVFSSLFCLIGRVCIQKIVPQQKDKCQ